MGRVRQVLAPVGAVVHAARRPASYAGHLREVVSTAVTAGVWPTGFGGQGLGHLHDLEAPDTVVEAPVLLVHGYGANKSNWVFVRRYLHQAGFGRLHAFNYNALVADIPRLAERCAEQTDELRTRLGVDRVHLVGHSLGGIIARYAVQVLGLRGVGVCVTIASPHGGVRLARYGAPLASLAPLHSASSLRPDSTVMTLLRSSARPLPTRFVAYYSNLDLVVAARRAMIVEPELDATNVLVKDHGHLSILWSRQLASSVVEQLGAAEGLPGYGSRAPSLESRRAPAGGGPLHLRLVTPPGEGEEAAG